ncbi:MAG: hypothetical protein KF901_25980 [Myxococcales bacterium]|nr:hypothetical protein [Myxococcales bacterium]
MTRLLQRALFAATFAATLVATLGHATAEAQEPTRGEILVVLAKETPGQIAPELASHAALQRPPFNAFRSMDLLERRAFTLRPGQTEEATLPNGRKLRIELQRVMPDGRFRVKVSIQREGESDYLPLLQVVASPGDPFFVAGQSHLGGTLVIGIQLGAAPR